MSDKIKITEISLDEMKQDDFKAPSKFYFVNALGIAIFIHCRERWTAEKYITDNYGKGFYKLRTASIEKPKGDVTACGSNTRKGFSSRLKGIRG